MGSGVLRGAVIFFLWAGAALAYRPFDGNNADTAAPGSVVVELGPAQFQRQGNQRSLDSPALSLTWGFAPRWELGLDVRGSHDLSLGPQDPSVVGTGLIVKRLLRQGSVQGATGPSLALEADLLPPEINGGGATGASAAVIVSHAWAHATGHVTMRYVRTRERNDSMIFNGIVEGPSRWTVRPVAELAHERDGTEPYVTSLLAGAVWTLRSDLSLDAAYRVARVESERSLHELRAGFTWTF